MKRSFRHGKSPCKTEGQLSPALCHAFDCEPAIAGIAGTILPLATLPPFAVIWKSHEQEVDQFLSKATAAPGGLLICVLFVTIICIELIDQVSMQVSQLADSIGPADRFVIVLAEPGEPLFEQRQHPLNKRLGATIFVCHAVLLMMFKNWETERQRDVACDSSEEAELHGWF
jgi:hypothetical protein